MLKETESPIAARPVAPAAAVRTRVLTLLSPYLPGYRSGGPVQSMSKTIQVLARAVQVLRVDERSRSWGYRALLLAFR